jgi:hypothetical protein
VSKTYVRVSADQVRSARALIRLIGDARKVDPVIVKIANAQRGGRGGGRAGWAAVASSRHAAGGA